MYSSQTGLTKNINELQSDILAEKLSSNPYLKYHVLIEKNNKLGTTSQTVIGAINEVLRKVQSTSSTNKAALAELYNVLGHVGVQPHLVTRVLKEAPSLIELVLSILDRVNAADATRTISHKDIFNVDTTPQVYFNLSHTPNQGTVTININGVKYYDGFNVNYDELILQWLFTESSGGFDITNSEVVIEYTYDSMKEQEANENG